MDQPTEVTDERTRLRELCLVFLKLGVIGFGGPAAHIALMRQELVARKKWLSDQEFLDLIGATNLIPGPNSTEMAIHIGYLRGKWPGLFWAGTCFILPAALIVTAIAWLYVHYGRLPEVEGALHGVKPIIVVVVFQALWGLGRSVLKRSAVVAVAVLGAILNLLGVHELAVLFGGGAVMALWSLAGPGSGRVVLSSLFAPFGLLIASSHAAASVTLSGLFLVFVKIGAVLFGSGYVLIAFLRADFVERFQWLTESQLLDAVAVGQATPGPTFTTATFIGYVLAGLPGAFVATVAIFLPAFVFVALSGPIVARIRRSATAGAFLDGINATSLSLMAVVTWQLAAASVVDIPSIAIAVGSAAAILLLRINVTWLIAVGAAAGYLISVSG